MGGHMGGATAMHGTHPLWYLLGTVVAVALAGGGYLAVRDQFVADDATGTTSAVMADDPVAADAGVDSAADTAGDGGTGDTVESSDADEPDRPSRPLLDVLPEDERRILQPVVDSPGLTQIELRDRADFSKSKVSQTVSDLEQRGLLYREPQGRTYRVYPSDELDEP
nr:MarR family transcriptional regulator [Natranaeroarchaeum aerophilus]